MTKRSPLRSSGTTHNINGKSIGISNDNPFLNTMLYKSELPDGAVEELADNSIAENLWEQCDDDGFMCQILDEIVDHRTNGQVISTEDAYIDTPFGQKLRKTTIGWELCCRWRDRETSWKISNIQRNNIHLRSMSTMLQTRY